MLPGKSRVATGQRIKGEIVTIMTLASVFISCYDAMQRGELIRRRTRRDKEFHFQDWVGDRIAETGFSWEVTKRNKYPDYVMTDYPEGFEVKGLETPGRQADFDCNSQLATGMHEGKSVYYIFGRYPKKFEGDQFPVLDLVICHGDFLNAHHDYVHKNDSFRDFGSYGDILVRDRKMYVAPTPYALADGLTSNCTLIARKGEVLDGADSLREVGSLIRADADKIAAKYTFDFRDNSLRTELADNPTAGFTRAFTAFRAKSDPAGEVGMKP
ncbi:hypothetical protein NPS70_11310 [Streptomyces sp. C10-9-1]|uniref:hypothetical protein n=1 Tax=Streptomyces sp. C10-9-1 TaxID=1859285 RepID=UPI002111BCAA|nr:hypothetical protein [Streptomyces sp. C10-9-1]MCQ6553779.1 hypothetical protein [Streptomyces sp. C10-9-1]